MKFKVNYLLLFVLSILFTSCSTDSEGDNAVAKITPDLFIQVRLMQDVITHNNELYSMELTRYSEEDSLKANTMYLRKIGFDGSSTILNGLLYYSNFSSTDLGGFVIDDMGRPICVSDKTNTIFSFNEEQTTVYENEIAPIAPEEKAKFSSITRFDEDSFLAYDNQSHIIRGFTWNINPTNLEIGTIGLNAIKDGTEEQAAFRHVSKMIKKDDIIYLVDDRKYIRTIEKTATGVQVSTIADTKGLGKITDIAFDKVNDEFIVSVHTEGAAASSTGLMALNLESKTFEQLVTGTISLDVSDTDYEQSPTVGWDHWGKIDHIQIIGNDLYFEQLRRFIKISDYRSKIRQ